MKQHAFILLLLLHASILVQGQQAGTENIPQVGKPLPPFVLHNVEYFDKSTVTNDDFKGRWLFLYFWYRGCGACLTGFGKINELQQRFRKDITFQVVGVNGEMDFGKGIRPFYERLRERQNLQLTTAYDSVLRERWGFNSFPHILIVDPAGTVRAITGGLDMTAEKIEELIKGREVSFIPAALEEPVFDPGNRETHQRALYRSLLVPWQGEREGSAPIFDYWNPARVSCMNLDGLYNLAYIGNTSWLWTDSLYTKVFPRPVWEVKDDNSHAFDYVTGKGIYNYELTLPEPKRKREIMEAMQRELFNAFGFEVTLEVRDMPVLKLVATKGAGKRLKTTGSPPGFTVDIEGDGGAAGFGYRNFPITFLHHAIAKFVAYPLYPCLDETGITHNIDIDMNVNMMDQEAVKKELQKNGLDLVLAKKRMTVVVIREINRSSLNN